MLEGNPRMNKQLILRIDDELLILETMSKDLADEWPAPVSCTTFSRFVASGAGSLYLKELCGLN